MFQIVVNVLTTELLELLGIGAETIVVLPLGQAYISMPVCNISFNSSNIISLFTERTGTDEIKKIVKNFRKFITEIDKKIVGSKRVTRHITAN